MKTVAPLDAPHEGIATLLATNTAFRRVWLAQLISLAGDWFNSVALLGLSLELTGSGMMVSLLVIANTLPMFFLAPLAGVVADRFDRRRVMIVTCLLQGLLALSFLLVHRPHDTWIIYAGSIALVTCEAFFLPASNAALPNLVTPRQLAAANALGGSTWGAMLAVGAALGGFVTARWGRAAAFELNALSFVVAAALVASVRVPFAQAVARPTSRLASESVVAVALRDFREGLRYALAHRDVLAILLIKMCWGLGSGVIPLLTVIPVAIFHAGDAGIGMLYSVRGAATVCGPLLALALACRRPRRMAFLAGLGVIACGLFCGAFATAPTLTWAAVFVFLSYLGAGALWTLSSTLLQRTVPDAVMGRISAIDLGGVTLTMSLSCLACGQGLQVAGIGPQRVGAWAGVVLMVLGVAWIAWYFAARPVDFERSNRLQGGETQADLA